MTSHLNDGNSPLLKRLAALPPFPTMALRLLSISTESATAIDDYENAFKADPALATDLLLTANSAEFGLPARVSSVRQAVTLLGLERVNSLSLTIAMRYYMRESTPRLQVLQPLWTHSIATAVIAEALANATGQGMPGLYTAGLVHDVGRLGLLMSAGKPYASMLSEPVVSLEDALVDERSQFGIVHTEAGAIMTKSWGLPDLLSDAIRCHHDPAPPRSDQGLNLIQLACCTASALGYGEQALANGAAILEIPPELPGRPVLDPESLRQRISKLLYSMSAPT